MQHSVFILTFLLLSLPALATCIVIVRTDKEIIVGQDSRRITVNKQGVKDGSQDDYCKIRETNGFYYTLVGAHDLLQIAVASSVSKESKNLGEFAYKFSSALDQEYEVYFGDMLKNNPDNFYKWLPGNPPLVTEVAMFKIEEGKPHLIVCTFFMPGKLQGSTKVMFEGKENARVQVLGYKDEYYYMPLDERNKLRSLADTEPYQFVEKVISLENHYHPDMVGGPIYYLSLSDDKKKWLPKEPSC